MSWWLCPKKSFSKIVYSFHSYKRLPMTFHVKMVKNSAYLQNLHEWKYIYNLVNITWHQYKIYMICLVSFLTKSIRAYKFGTFLIFFSLNFYCTDYGFVRSYNTSLIALKFLPCYKHLIYIVQIAHYNTPFHHVFKLV